MTLIHEDWKGPICQIIFWFQAPLEIWQQTSLILLIEASRAIYNLQNFAVC